MVGKLAAIWSWGMGSWGGTPGMTALTKMCVHPMMRGAHVDMEGRYGGIIVEGELVCPA